MSIIRSSYRLISDIKKYSGCWEYLKNILKIILKMFLEYF